MIAATGSGSHREVADRGRTGDIPGRAKPSERCSGASERSFGSVLPTIPTGWCRVVRSGRHRFPRPVPTLGPRLPPHGGPTRDASLEPWASHGVLLLNTVLTVRRGQAWSHAHPGWEDLTAAIIAAVAAKLEPVVFLLWGRQAQRAGASIDSTRHIVLRASHPSLRSARRPCGDAPPFSGSAPFSRANAEIARRGRPRVNWDLGPDL